MKSKEARREAARRFKEQKVPIGAYAVRCLTTGKVWVGASRNLGATRNQCMISLQFGAHIDKSLQAEWNAQGERAFVYEVLEVAKEDLHPLAVPDVLRELRRTWVEELGARALN